MLSQVAVSAVLPVRDLAAAKEFYQQKIGLKLVEDGDGVATFAAGAGTLLNLFESDSQKSDDTAASFEVKDLAKEMSELRGKGVVFEEYDLPGIKTVNGVTSWGEDKAAWFKDPGGNVLCLHQSGK